MTIKEVEEKLNINRANIRFYEKEGLLITKRNPINGYRDYSEKNIESIKKVLFFRNLEISIEEIRLVQADKLNLEDLLSRHVKILKNKEKTYKDSIDICFEMISNSDFKLDELKVERYCRNSEIDKYTILKDTISNLSVIKYIVISWALILISLLIAIIAFPFLPNQISIEWSGMSVIKESHKMILFLFPIISIAVVVVARTMVWYVLYQNMPFNLMYVDVITECVYIGVLIMILTYQIYTILFISGFRQNLDRILIIELCLFIIFILTSVFFSKKKSCAY